MPNGNEIKDAMDFEGMLSKLQGDELTKFIARQLYEHVQQQQITDKKVIELNEKQDERIIGLEGQGKRFAGAVGGVSGVTGAVLIAVVNRLFPS